MKRIIRLVPFFVVLAVLSIGMALPVAGQTPDDRQLYVPLLTQDHNYGRSISIYGRASNTNDADLVLTLDFFDGETTTTFLTTVVSRRYPYKYAFLNLPPLEAGQTYTVNYYNGQHGNLDAPEHLKSWHSFPITDSANGSFVEHNFSVYNIQTLFPSEGRQVRSPFSFQWRRGNLENHYQLNMYDTNATLLYSITGGQVESYLFDALSAGLSLNTPYLWDVTIANPDGSIGIGYDPKHEVTFVAEPPIGVPTGLTAQCSEATGDHAGCWLSWQPPQGATQYLVEVWVGTLHIGNWVDSSSVHVFLNCSFSPQHWRVRARSTVAEGPPTDLQMVTVPPCPPPCSPCMREMFKEQPEWQPYQREPY